MNGIKMSDCNFYVNEDKRTIVCVIPECITDSEGRENKTKDMVNDYINDNFCFSDFEMQWALSDNFQKKLEMPHSFVGKAVCAPEDEWDEEIGKLIAFSRAKDKCYRSFFKRANLFIQKLDNRLGDMIEHFNDFGMKLENKREALQAKIDEKVPSEEE